MVSIARQLLKTGLLQFGLFENPLTKTMTPYRLQLDVLAAYPELLQKAAEDALPCLETYQGDRLVSTSDAIPIGTLMSQQTGIPLVYSRGCGESGVHDLIGSYDVGHPAILVAHTLTPQIHRLIQQAKRVGLEIASAVVLVDTGYQPDNVTVYGVWSLAAIVSELADTQMIPAGQAEAVQQFLNEKSAL